METASSYFLVSATDIPSLCICTFRWRK